MPDLGLILVYAAIGGLTALALLPAEQRRAWWQGVRARLPLKVTLDGMVLVMRQGSWEGDLMAVWERATGWGARRRRY